MKVLILAGGLGTRISEESDFKPKPMVEIGGKPILWHIMKRYAYYGFNEFVVLCGYKGYVIKDYFANYYKHLADLTINLQDNSIEYHRTHSEPWKITLIDTGLETMTGGRVKRVAHYLNNEPFMLTYGDGVADIDIRSLLDFHRKHGKLFTLTAIQPEGRFGVIDANVEGLIEKFEEKPKGDGAWINGGYFVCQPEVLNYIEGDHTILEQEPFNKLAKDGELMAYQHRGFWKPMDTLRDKNQLERLIREGNAPWITW